MAASINSASDGDTIVIPSGTCTWTTNLTIEKAVTVQGAGIDRTVIIDGVSKAPYPNVPQLLIWRLKSTGIHRLTGLTIDGGSGDNDQYNTGIVRIFGASVPNFRMDHCRVITRRTAGLQLYNVLGVIDHCAFDLTNFKFGIYTFHPNWKGVGDFGDNSWAQPTGFGSENFLFIEDCTFTSVSGSHVYAVDGWSGSRVVYRYNTFTNTTWANHGTESGGRLRGTRAFEIYGNNFVANNSGVVLSSAIGSRSGVAAIWNNRLSTSGGAYFSRFIDLNNLRSGTSYSPWGACDGSGAWDQNTAGQSGWRCLDQVGVGHGNLLSGQTPTPSGWPNQVTDPNYIWGNTSNGAPTGAVSVKAHIQENRDFYNSAKPGYVPYTYPHPLTNGATAPSAPAAPTNLSIVR